MKHLRKFNEDIISHAEWVKQKLKSILKEHGCYEDDFCDSDGLGIDCDTTGIDLGKYKGVYISAITTDRMKLENGKVLSTELLTVMQVNDILKRILFELDQ